MSAPEPLLRVRDLSVTFPARHGRPPVPAVDRVSFDIEAGRTLGLVGESGSGKTTAGRAILQLQPIAGGSVRLLGRELTGMARAAFGRRYLRPGCAPRKNLRTPQHSLSTRPIWPILNPPAGG